MRSLEHSPLIRWVDKHNLVSALSSLLVVGALFICTRHYLSHRAFWIDEAFIASNIQLRAPLGLFGPLEHGQVFPRIYLTLIGITKTLLGYEFWTLRLVPFLFGLGGVVLWSFIFWREFSVTSHKVIAWFAIAAFLAAPDIYYFAGELKQYSSDLFFSGYGYWFGRYVLFPLIENEDKRKWLILGWVWPVFFSLTYVFVVAAFTLVILLYWWIVEKRRPLSWSATTVVGLLLSAALSYGTDLRYAQNQDLVIYWRNFFVDTSSVAQFFNSITGHLKNISSQFWICSPFKSLVFLGLALMGIIGVVFGFTRKRQTSFLTLTGFVLICELTFLSVFKKYPLAPGRTMFFFFPYYVGMIALVFYELSHVNVNLIRLAGAGGAALLAMYFSFILVPRSWKIYYQYGHWQDVNSLIKYLDPAVSKRVVYSQPLDFPIKTHPHLPNGFTYLSFPEVHPYEVPMDECRKRLGDSFYLIGFQALSSMQDQLQQLLHIDISKSKKMANGVVIYNLNQKSKI